ncbi:MAG: D-ribose pyranase [Beutenbergiaceae bacterium]
MKRIGIINSLLARELAAMRHTDLFVISDGGFPAGPRDRVIDLAVTPGLPRFEPVLAAVLAEVEIEESWIAAETAAANPEREAGLAAALGEAHRVPHEELKRLAERARFVVRTGENTPYSNVLLRAGYPF